MLHGVGQKVNRNHLSVSVLILYVGDNCCADSTIFSSYIGSE